MPSNDEPLPLSAAPFKGIRGLVADSNIISLRACLKNGRCLIDIEEARGNWITQYPPKDEFTEVEVKIRAAADTIIAETLESFKSKDVTVGTISSTPAARDSVSLHYYSIFRT